MFEVDVTCLFYCVTATAAALARPSISKRYSLLEALRAATGRQMRRSPFGGIIVKSAVAVFG
ncbi:hypothetical protein CN071_31375 [Sinorhizobium meliloti]|nr:hypothetical protein CN127_30185 [Sinorhizobium meliloti]RVN59163.1 hypothetical protein CN106_31060 [Sinorhizobium meliloti]RVO29095.1 hypothetical protein CN095_26020 [Sinorhizobium meliloti]RVP53779.1 hypothetical protein CN071_31375 [Sinorhizobium meliloti]